jgi:hypothetical protein
MEEDKMPPERVGQGHVPPFLPPLTVNRPFMRAFLSADPPCFALGMVEERKRQCGLLALRPDEDIPADISAKGFHFGHALFGNASFEVIHFVFEFYGFQTSNVLINPNNPLVQAVLATMLDGGDYFFFALNAHGGATAFRAEMGQEGLSALQANLARMQHATTTDGQYHQALASFADHPQPEGILLNWVCWDHVDY